MTSLFLINGKINTQDPKHPEASALAIRDGRFIAAGSDDEIRAMAENDSRFTNLEGRRVIPGLVDSHVHYHNWALGLKQLKLENTHSLTDMLELLGKSARATASNHWICGQGWNHTTWEDSRPPTRKELDSVSMDHPVILYHSSLHMAVANSMALQIAGITNKTPDPPQGVIDRDRSGNPTGILRDLAMNIVTGVIPPMDEAEAAEAFKEGFKIFHSLGLTGVHDQRLMDAPEYPAAFHIWQRLHASNEIQLRVWMNLPGNRLEEIVSSGLRTGFGDDYFRIGHVKYFADGAQGPRTAWLLEPYEGTNSTGLQLTPIRDIAKAIHQATAAGLAVCIHAIGDRANRELIEVFEELEASNTNPAALRPSAPHKIEHVQIIQPEDLKRMSKLNIIASVQPISVTDDIPMMEPTIGARSKLAYQYRTMWDAGIKLTFNSDCPVSDPNPFWGIHAAVTRRRRDGTPEEGWYPEQCVTVDQAVWAYSMGAAVASGRQADLGSISPGKLADLVVLDRDIFSIDPMEIYNTKPTMTIFDGKIVYEA
ncbi:N-substituted formamide deformylase [Anaerolineales bacterium]|nr:N-substituted formamide deformylase [Anaerolineales bacterium]